MYGHTAVTAYAVNVWKQVIVGVNKEIHKEYQDKRQYQPARPAAEFTDYLLARLQKLHNTTPHNRLDQCLIIPIQPSSVKEMKQPPLADGGSC